MNKLDLAEVTKYVEDNIGTFHQKRLDALKKLKLTKVLKNKNPYLFKAKNLVTGAELVKGVVDAYVSSSEEGIFGDWLEGLVIFINGKVYGGRKSTTEGIDLEFDLEGVRYIVTIKSGPNWGNSNQIQKMRDHFRKALKTLRTSNSKLNIIAVNGCCYGIDNKPNKGDYHKYCGQEFWEFISGDSELFMKIIEPLGTMAKESNEEFLDSYNKKLNLFTIDFLVGFCDEDGAIDWEKLVKFNSGKQLPNQKK